MKTNKKKIKRWWLKLLLIAVLVIFAAVGFAASASDKHTGVSFFGYKIYSISSGSMQPEYKVGSLVLVKSGEINDAEVGDVIVFAAPALSGKPAFHRIIKSTEAGHIVKGDNNEHADNLAVTENEYVGKAVFHVNITADFILIILSLAAVALMVSIIWHRRRVKRLRSVI